MRPVPTLAELVSNGKVEKETCFSRVGTDAGSYVFSRQDGGQLYGYQLDTLAGATSAQLEELMLNPEMPIVLEEEETMMSRHPGRLKTIMAQL